MTKRNGNEGMGMDMGMGMDNLSQVLVYPYKCWQQCKQAQPPEKQFLLQCHLCSNCFSRLPPHENLCICQSGHMQNGAPITEELFIDNKIAEQLMVLNDTILLTVEMVYLRQEVQVSSDTDTDS